MKYFNYILFVLLNIYSLRAVYRIIKEIEFENYIDCGLSIIIGLATYISILFKGAEWIIIYQNKPIYMLLQLFLLHIILCLCGVGIIYFCVFMILLIKSECSAKKKIEWTYSKIIVKYLNPFNNPKVKENKSISKKFLSSTSIKIIFLFCYMLSGIIALLVIHYGIYQELNLNNEIFQFIK